MTDVLLGRLQSGDIACQLLLPSGQLLDALLHGAEIARHRLLLVRRRDRGRGAGRDGVQSSLCNGCGLRCIRWRRLNGRCARLCGGDFGTGWRVGRGQQPPGLGQQGYWPAKLRCPARDYLLGGLAVRFPSQDASDTDESKDQEAGEREARLPNDGLTLWNRSSFSSAE